MSQKMGNRQRVYRNLVLATAAVAGLTGWVTPYANAQNGFYTWSGPATGSWNTPAGGVWLGAPGAMPNSATDTALIDGDAGRNSTVIVNGNFNVGTLTINIGDAVTIQPSNTLNVSTRLNNGGTVSLGANSSLQTGGNLTIDSGGFILLSDSNLGTNGGSVLNLNNLITGTGNIGGNNTTWTNQGIIDANVNGGHIFIDPQATATAFTNTGTLTASNGGNLRFNGQFGGGVINSGGTISAQNGSFVSFENSIGVTGGTFTSSGTGMVRTLAGHTASVTAIANLGNWTLENNSTTNVAGGADLFNAGSINVVAGVNHTTMNFNTGTTNLTGGGVINLSTTGAGVARVGDGNGRLVNVNNTIRGFGHLGSNNQRFSNGTLGVVSANVAGNALFVDPVAETNAFTNTGVMRAENGGILQFTGQFGGAVHNNNGTIAALTGSEVQLYNSNLVVGGTLTSSGTGVVRNATGQQTSIQDLTNTGNLVVDPNSTLLMNAGVITNTGSINVNAGTNTHASLNGAGGTVLLNGSGVINLTRGSSGGEAFLAGTGVVIVNNTNVRGTGNIAANNAAFINNGTISADVNGGAIFVDAQAGGGTIDFTNNGTMQASNGGILQFTGQFGGQVNNGAGRIIANNASQVQLINSVGVVGGTFTSNGTGTVNVPSGQTASVANITNTGAIVVTNNAALQASGSINNAANITLTAGANHAVLRAAGASVTFGGAGTIHLESPGAGRAILGDSGGTITNGATHTVRGVGNIAGNNGVFINNGTVNADVNGGVIFVDPQAVADSFVNNKLMTATGGGVLQFNGQFGGGVTNNGTISAANASVVQLQNTIGVTGGTFTSSGSGAVEVQAGHSAFVANARNEGAFNIQNNSTLHGIGTLLNNGVIAINPGANNAMLNSNAGGTLLLSGSGTVNMNAGTASAVLGLTGGTIDIVNTTVRGRGVIAANNISLINHGTIVASGGGELFIDPQAIANSFINFGTMRAETGSQLQFNGQFGGGASNRGHLDVQAGGTLLTNNSHALSSTGGTVTLNGVWNATNSSVSQVDYFRGAGTLNVNSSARVNVTPNGTTAGTSRVAGLNISGAKLDLTDNDMVIDYTAGNSPLTTVRGYLQTGSAGNWTGNGIITSMATSIRRIGYAEASAIRTTFPATFSDQQVDNTTVLLKYTYAGDADLNGQVNFDDYSRADLGFNTGGTTWSQGDFDYNGQVNFDDYALLDLAFNTQGGTLIRAMDWLEGEDRSMRGMDAPELQKVVEHFQQFGNGYATSFLTAVPEPTSLVAIGLGAVAFGRRRRRRA